MPSSSLIHGYPVSRGRLDREFPEMWEWLMNNSPINGAFRARMLLMKVWDKDLTGAFLRECATLPWPANRLIRVRRGWYEWCFAQCADADSAPDTYRTPDGRLVQL